MKDCKELKAGEKAQHLTLQLSDATREFRRAEIYGLTSQMRRVAVSVGANMAEGCGRRGGRIQAFLANRGWLGERVGASLAPVV